jgi:hypothetical protein
MDIANDILEQMQRDFPDEELAGRLAQLAEATKLERLQRCIVFASRGHPWYFEYLCRLAKVDYRDVIMAAEYERDAKLYDFSKPIGEARIDDPYGSRWRPQ